jgi:pimeloyl-ACP methyl ester carboxylesterase
MRRQLPLILLALTGCTSPVAVTPASLDATLLAEKKLPLQAKAESVLLKQATPAEAKGTIVMYHGFSAGTWQYEFLQKQAFDAGYNVYVPRLPGHGLQDPDGAHSPRELPTGRTAEEYEDFAERTFKEAAALGAPVSVAGLSVGGAVALRVAEKHPEVKRAIAYAPFMRPQTMGWVFDSARTVDVVPLGLADSLLSAVPWGWGAECEALENAGQRPGHCKFSLGTINGAMAFGDVVIKEASKLQVPTQFFVTASDDAADEGAIRRVYVASAASAKAGWYYYPKEEGIPHPMLHPSEDKGKGQTPALYAMSMAFFENGTAVNRGDLPK